VNTKSIHSKIKGYKFNGSMSGSLNLELELSYFRKEKD
jgi:hypothetical protein